MGGSVSKRQLWQIQSGQSPSGTGGHHDPFAYVVPQPSSLDTISGFVEQMGSPVGTILPSPPALTVGVDVPFYWQNITAREHTPQTGYHWTRKWHGAIHPLDHELHVSAIYLDKDTTPPDTTFLFFSCNSSFDLVALQNLARRRRAQWIAAGLAQENVRGIYVDFINGSQFATDSCTLLEEIQRHLLEPVIDQGRTWSLWTQAEVLGFLNMRLQRFALETGLIRKQAQVTAGSGNISYPSDLLEERRLGFGVTSNFPTSGIVSYWKLDEVTGTRADSIITTGNNLTDINTVPGIPGKISNAAFFAEASVETLSRSNNPTIQTGDISFTFAGWVNLTNGAFGGRKTIISKGVIFAGAEYFFCYNKGSDRFTFQVNASSELTAISLGSPGFGEWHFFVVWHDSVADTINIQMDNGAVDSLAYAGGGIANSSEFRISSSSDDARYHNGGVDEVGFWKRVLTADERTALWNDGDGLTYPSAPTIITSTLERIDQSASDNSYIDWENTTDTPVAFVEEPKNSGTFQLVPPPSVSGVVDVLYVPLPEKITAACTSLPFPNFFTNFIKWGVIADMLMKEGEANDPARANAAEQRWQEGIELAKTLLGDPKQ